MRNTAKFAGGVLLFVVAVLLALLVLVRANEGHGNEPARIEPILMYGGCVVLRFADQNRFGYITHCQTGSTSMVAR